MNMSPVIHKTKVEPISKLALFSSMLTVFLRRCSRCRNPKPMSMGFRVCEYCNSGPKVTILPAFARECPDCGQPRLDATRVYPPVTDEAMKEGIHPKYSSLTWECKCGHKNPYPFANCLKCGLPIDEGLNADADVDDPEKKLWKLQKKCDKATGSVPVVEEQIGG